MNWGFCSKWTLSFSFSIFFVTIHEDRDRGHRSPLCPRWGSVAPFHFLPTSIVFFSPAQWPSAHSHAPCVFQVLEGTSPYFGYSIAGNMDLDRNSYPDVAVGSLSDSVTIFRCVLPLALVKQASEGSYSSSCFDFFWDKGLYEFKDFFFDGI